MPLGLVHILKPLRPCGNWERETIRKEILASPFVIARALPPFFPSTSLSKKSGCKIYFLMVSSDISWCWYLNCKPILFRFRLSFVVLDPIVLQKALDGWMNIIQFARNLTMRGQWFLCYSFLFLAFGNHLGVYSLLTASKGVELSNYCNCKQMLTMRIGQKLLPFLHLIKLSTTNWLLTKLMVTKNVRLHISGKNTSWKSATWQVTNLYLTRGHICIWCVARFHIFTYDWFIFNLYTKIANVFDMN